jgi:hypothetical protein
LKSQTQTWGKFKRAQFSTKGSQPSLNSHLILPGFVAAPATSRPDPNDVLTPETTRSPPPLLFVLCPDCVAACAFLRLRRRSHCRWLRRSRPCPKETTRRTGTGHSPLFSVFFWWWRTHGILNVDSGFKGRETPIFSLTFISIRGPANCLFSWYF